mgnify:CR=1 FL=1
MTSEELQAGVPVVIPDAFCFECVDLSDAGTPAAVMVHCFLDGAAVAGCYIADHAVDVKQQQALQVQWIESVERLLG